MRVENEMDGKVVGSGKEMNLGLDLVSVGT